MSQTDTPTASKIKIGIRSITIDRAEGKHEECIKTEHTTWADAEARIIAICTSKDPTLPGYDKTDFVIVFADGETYSGRYDAVHPTRDSYDGSLAKHVREHCEFCAGLWKPSHLTDEQYERWLAEQEANRAGFKADALGFLTKYALHDLPTDPPKDPPMDTTTAAPTATQKSPKEAHDENVAIGKASGRPWMPLAGNTFPVKGLLFCLGGKYDPATKSWSVPAHKREEAQAAVDKFTRPAKPKPAAPAPTVAAPRPTMTPSTIPPTQLLDRAFIEAAIVKMSTISPDHAKVAQSYADGYLGMRPCYDQLMNLPIPAPVRPAPKPAKKNAKPFRSPMQKRLDALLAGAEAIRKDLPTDKNGELFFALEHIRKTIEGLG